MITEAEFGLIKEYVTVLFQVPKFSRYYSVAKEEPFVLKRKIKSQYIDRLVKMFSNDLKFHLDCRKSHYADTNYSMQCLEAYLELSQTSAMELVFENSEWFLAVYYFWNKSIVDIWMSSKYASETSRT